MVLAPGPLDLIELYDPDPGEKPDIIEWIFSDKYLDRGTIYPRQGTLLKILFLQPELFTTYDEYVIEQWIEGFRLAEREDEGVLRFEGEPGKYDVGIQPDIMERIAVNKAAGRKWFREAIPVVGRRGGKGHIGALGQSYVLYNYMTVPGGDPQRWYGVDRDKALSTLVFAGKLEHAKANQWRDIVNVITGAPWFKPYIAANMGEKLSLWSPADRAERGNRGGPPKDGENPSFEILPKESTTTAGRGPTSMCLDPETPVLKADLTWAPIKDIQPGDHLIGVDEYAPTGGNRRLRDAVVEAVRWTRNEVIRFTFDDGSSVTCSGNHRWLTREMGNGGTYRWFAATSLKEGHRIRAVVDPWELDTSHDAAFKTIVRVEHLPEQDLVDIQSSTRTFVANGLVSHNSLFFDEMAHVTKATARASAEDVYSTATPSLDQFGLDGFIYQGSSPWQMTGQFYVNYQQAMEVDPDTHKAVYPEKLMVQLQSWDIYTDWNKAHRIPRVPGDSTYVRKRTFHFLDGGAGEPASYPAVKYPIQIFDESMEKLEKSNPETFKVERRCLDPDTRVLCSDLTWRPIKDLGVGDELVALDEEGSNGKERRLRTAIVEATARVRDKAYRIEFDDGSHVICSGLHRWLSATPKCPSNHRWRSIEVPPEKPGPRTVMKVGDSIRAVVEPWGPDESRDAGWLAGLYDGEGCIINRNRLRTEFRIDLAQNKGTVLDRALKALWERGFTPRDATHHSRDCQTYKITGLSECLRLLGQIRPYRLLENGNPGMWEGRALGHENGGRYSKVITEITELPEQELVDIQTSTRTFIAEGLVSHNSQWAAVIDAYLSETSIAKAFEPWALVTDIDPYGQPTEPKLITQQTQGLLSRRYTAHADPGKSNDNFGIALGHLEGPDYKGYMHVVFDRVHHWAPVDYEDHQVDYPAVEEEIFEDFIVPFMPDLMTFDQFSSVQIMQGLRRRIIKASLPRRTLVEERTATNAVNWAVAETFKTALNMGWIHLPPYEMLRLEMTFLQDKGKRVDHPSSGPVQSKDVWDAVSNVVYALLGSQVEAYRSALESIQVRGIGPPGGMIPDGTSPTAMGPNAVDESIEDRFAALRTRHANPGGMPGRGRRR